MKLPDIRDFDIKEKRVLLRVNLDVPLKKDKRYQILDETRIQESIPTISNLLARKAKVVILAHLGRPGGTYVSYLSLKKVALRLSRILGRELPLIKEFGKIDSELACFENLRFFSGEENNERSFAKKLSSLGDFYVNDAFAVCHRKHASVVLLPRLLPHAAGLDLLEEVKILSEVRENPKRPVVVIVGGVKKSKLLSVEGLINWADLVLVGGKLVSYPEAKKLKDHRKKLAFLSKTGEDITVSSACEFAEKIKKAGTIIWSGPLGKFEDKRFERGTRIFAEAMASSQAFRIVGGGDTEAALTRFNLEHEIDFISSGGGAMLEFFAKGDLPGLKALRKKKK